MLTCLECGRVEKSKPLDLDAYICKCGAKGRLSIDPTVPPIASTSGFVQEVGPSENETAAGAVEEACRILSRWSNGVQTTQDSITHLRMIGFALPDAMHLLVMKKVAV